MARLPRLALAGLVHHVVQQGHNGQPVFLSDQDRIDYLAMLQEAARAQAVAIHAYALLDQAVHLLATPARADSLGRLMQALGRRYVSAYNRRHGRSGTLWNGRFRSSVIQTPALVIPATVAIECLLPPEQRTWTSAPHHLGQQRSAMLTEHLAYWSLGNTPFERELSHAKLLREGPAPALVQQMASAIRASGVVGDAAFCAEVAGLTGRPVQARRRGRPARASAHQKVVPN